MIVNNILYSIWFSFEIYEGVLFCYFQVFELNAVTGKGLSALSFPYLWIEKAQVLIQLGLYQPARLLLSEAHAAAQVRQK